MSADQYDRYVSARLPPGPPRGDPVTGECLKPGCICRKGYAPHEYDPQCDPVLWHAVLKQMVHVCDSEAPCRDESTGNCKYRYDELRYVEATVHADKRRPEYERLPPPPPGAAFAPRAKGVGRFAHKKVKDSHGVASERMITDAMTPQQP